MSKIGDLFVRLGLKKDDYSKGIKEAQGELSGFAKSSKVMATVAKAAWAAVAAAVVKFAKDAISLTQRWGDQWNITMAGVKGAYQTFVRQLASGEGFSNLFANMRESARVAREVAAELDKVFERNISYSYEEAKAIKEIEQARTDMRDQSKTEEERKAAAEFVVQKEEELGQLRVSNAQKEAAAYRKQLKNQTGLNDEQIKFLTEEYLKNEDLIDQAIEYRKEREKAEGKAGFSGSFGGSFGTGYNQGAANAAAADVDAKYDESVKRIAEWTRLYEKGNDEIVQAMANAEVKAMQAEADIITRQRRAETTLGSLNKTDTSGGPDTGAEQAAEIQKRAEDSAKNRLQLLMETYQQERALLIAQHQDTTALDEEYWRNRNAILQEGLKSTLELVDDFDKIDTDDLFDIDMSSVDQELEDMSDRAVAAFDEMMAKMQDFGDVIAGGFTDACQELMNQLVGLEDFNPGAIVSALLTPLADMAVKAGEIIVAEGIAVEAAKTALATFGGYGAIAAGAALVVAGTAAKAGLSALARGGKTTASTSSSAANGTGASTQNIETELTIRVEGRLSGSDIVLAGQKTLNNWSR